MLAHVQWRRKAQGGKCIFQGIVDSNGHFVLGSHARQDQTCLKDDPVESNALALALEQFDGMLTRVRWRGKAKSDE